MTSSVGLWKPYKIIKIDKTRTQCCWTLDNGEKCRQTIRDANLRPAKDLLCSISHLDPSPINLNIPLYDIARRLLCQRWHQDRIDDVVDQWKEDIQAYLDDKTANEELERVQQEVEDDYVKDMEAQFEELRIRRRQFASPMDVDGLNATPSQLRPAATSSAASSMISDRAAESHSHREPRHRDSDSSSNSVSAPSTVPAQQPTFGNRTLDTSNFAYQSTAPLHMLGITSRASPTGRST